MHAARSLYFFFFNDTATTEIYTLSLHDALPICQYRHALLVPGLQADQRLLQTGNDLEKADRKSTRLNSSHVRISYAVFCLKKKKKFSRKSVTINQNTKRHQC